MVGRDHLRAGLARNFIHEILPSASLRLDLPLDAGPIDLLDLAAFELSPQPPGGIIVSGQDHYAAGRPIQPVRQAEVHVLPAAALAEELLDLHFEAIDARRGLREHAGVLADHQAGAVFVKNIESGHGGQGLGTRDQGKNTSPPAATRKAGAPVGLCSSFRLPPFLNIPARASIDEPERQAVEPA